MSKKPFNYTAWLESLKIGDRIKVGRSGGSCECEKTEVVGINVNSDDEKVIIIASDCKTRYFCQKTGREIGNKKGSWKDASLVPYTDKDRQAEEEAEKIKKEKQEKSELANQVSELIGVDGYYNLSSLSKERLTVIRKALNKVPELKYKQF